MKKSTSGFLLGSLPMVDRNLWCFNQTLSQTSVFDMSDRNLLTFIKLGQVIVGMNARLRWVSLRLLKA